MRLVAWNANYNNRRRSHAQDVEHLRHLRGDILVISETSVPGEGVPASVGVVGRCSPSLAVVVGPGLHMEPHPANATAPELMGGWQITGRVSFKLLAVWPVLRSSSSYHQILMKGLSHYGSFLADGPVVFAGDMNTSTRVKDQTSTHGMFVGEARRLGLRSVYHERSGEEHGQETHETFRRAGSSFHVDYCFVSTALAASATVNVLRSAEWCQLSDHSPVVLDVPDGAFVTDSLSMSGSGVS